MNDESNKRTVKEFLEVEYPDDAAAILRSLPKGVEDYQLCKQGYLYFDEKRIDTSIRTHDGGFMSFFCSVDRDHKVLNWLTYQRPQLVHTLEQYLRDTVPTLADDLLRNYNLPGDYQFIKSEPIFRDGERFTVFEYRSNGHGIEFVYKAAHDKRRVYWQTINIY